MKDSYNHFIIWHDIAKSNRGINITFWQSWTYAPCHSFIVEPSAAVLRSLCVFMGANVNIYFRFITLAGFRNICGWPGHKSSYFLMITNLNCQIDSDHSLYDCQFDSLAWRRHVMKTFSTFLCLWGIHRSPEDSTHIEPMGFDVFVDVKLNKLLNTQSNCWWFETLIRRHCNVPIHVCWVRQLVISWVPLYHVCQVTDILIETNQWTSSPQAVYAPRPTSCWYRNYTCRGRSLISLRYLIKVRIIFRSLTCMESNASTLLITGVTLCFPVLYVLLNITIILAYTGKWYRGYTCWSDWE